MKHLLVVIAVLTVASVGTVNAQEHWNEGPVWECSAYRTMPGHFDDYMEYLRKNVAAIRAEAEEQGLVVDQRAFVQVPSDPNDWDVMFCTAYKDGSAAMDYNAETEAKWEAIVAKHSGTADEDQWAEMTKPRFEMRKYLGTNMMREVELKPIE